MTHAVTSHRAAPTDSADVDRSPHDAEERRYLQQRIFAEQIRLLYKPLLPLLAVNVALACALVITLQGLVANEVRLVWFIALIAGQAYRLATHIAYRRAGPDLDQAAAARRFVIGSALTGITWGIGALALFPDNASVHQMVIVMVMIGLGAGAVTTHHAYLPALFLFLLPVLAPVTVQLFFMGTPILVALGLMLVVYIAFLSYYGRILHLSLTESLRLRFQNLALVDQLREQKEAAEQANIAKSKFLAAASHDLRQPLHALGLFTSVLGDSVTSPAHKKLVAQIGDSVHALESLFNALLDISRLDAGVMQPDKQHLALGPLFDRLKNEFAAQASAKQLTVHWPDVHGVVFTDATLFEQILRNYLSNAIRYTDDGHITVDYREDGPRVSITVRDTGPGIPKSERHRIFDEFHQLNNPERDRSKGLGLGLAIVKRTADLLGHTIRVDSTLDHGAAFSITVDKGDEAALAQSPPTEMSSAFDTPTGATLLVIDDEQSVRDGMKSRLEMWDCQVFSAANLEDALEQVEHGSVPIDGIIADYRLREGRTGAQAIQAIQACYGRAVPALIVTGDIAADRLRDVNESGFQVLHKPVPPAKLRAFIRHLKNQRTATPERS